MDSGAIDRGEDGAAGTILIGRLVGRLESD
jgi:hypothetical protein